LLYRETLSAEDRHNLLNTIIDLKWAQF
jgi:hypothetical protein